MVTLAKVMFRPSLPCSILWEEVQLRRQNEELRWTLKKHLFRSLVCLLMLEVNIVGVVMPQPFDQAGWLQEVAWWSLKNVINRLGFRRISCIHRRYFREFPTKILDEMRFQLFIFVWLFWYSALTDLDDQKMLRCRWFIQHQPAAGPHQSPRTVPWSPSHCLHCKAHVRLVQYFCTCDLCTFLWCGLSWSVWRGWCMAPQTSQTQGYPGYQPKATQLDPRLEHM